MLISLPLYLLMLSRQYDSVTRVGRRDLWVIIELIQPWPVYAYATVIALFSTVAPAYLMAEGIR